MSEPVRILSLAELGLGPSGFRRDHRFGRDALSEPVEAPPAEEEDPETRALPPVMRKGPPMPKRPSAKPSLRGTPPARRSSWRLAASTQT